MTTNNLGDQAQAGIVIADSQVRSPSFSQPYRQVGSPITPVTGVSANVPYIAGRNKYIVYFQLTNGFNITRSIAIRDIPANFSANYSVVSSTVCVASTQFDTAPQYVINQYQIDPNATSNRYVIVESRNVVGGVFTTGTAYLKLVVQFSLD